MADRWADAPWRAWCVGAEALGLVVASGSQVMGWRSLFGAGFSVALLAILACALFNPSARGVCVMARDPSDAQTLGRLVWLLCTYGFSSAAASVVNVRILALAIALLPLLTVYWGLLHWNGPRGEEPMS